MNLNTKGNPLAVARLATLFCVATFAAVLSFCFLEDSLKQPEIVCVFESRDCCGDIYKPSLSMKESTGGIVLLRHGDAEKIRAHTVSAAVLRSLLGSKFVVFDLQKTSHANTVGEYSEQQIARACNFLRAHESDWGVNPLNVLVVEIRGAEVSLRKNYSQPKIATNLQCTQVYP